MGDISRFLFGTPEFEDQEGLAGARGAERGAAYGLDPRAHARGSRRGLRRQLEPMRTPQMAGGAGGILRLIAMLAQARQNQPAPGNNGMALARNMGSNGMSAPAPEGAPNYHALAQNMGGGGQASSPGGQLTLMDIARMMREGGY